MAGKLKFVGPYALINFKNPNATLPGEEPEKTYGS
jgi:hypothetical protein